MYGKNCLDYKVQEESVIEYHEKLYKTNVLLLLTLLMWEGIDTYHSEKLCRSMLLMW